METKRTLPAPTIFSIANCLPSPPWRALLIATYLNRVPIFFPLFYINGILVLKENAIIISLEVVKYFNCVPHLPTPFFFRNILPHTRKFSLISQCFGDNFGNFETSNKLEYHLSPIDSTLTSPSRQKTSSSPESFSTRIPKNQVSPDYLLNAFLRNLKGRYIFTPHLPIYLIDNYTKTTTTVYLRPTTSQKFQ